MSLNIISIVREADTSLLHYSLLLITCQKSRMCRRVNREKVINKNPERFRIRDFWRSGRDSNPRAVSAATRFPIVLVMTTSIPLQVIACVPPCGTAWIIISDFLISSTPNLTFFSLLFSFSSPFIACSLPQTGEFASIFPPSCTGQSRPPCSLHPARW